MQKISKLTLTANNGVFKNLIQEVINNRELQKFKIIFSANIVETSIIITEKKQFNISPEDWNELFQFFEKKTKNIIFKQHTE